MNKEALSRAAAEARGLAIDAVHVCSSGHLGLPLGCADLGAVLFGEGLRFNPAAPKWLNRDRFILSAGHGSMFIYSWLHLAGFKVSSQDVADFRKLHSITPGHPEFDETEGVEATTGPLGQGVGNAVGYALSGKRAAARYNTADHTIFDHHVVALAGDGCLQEGVAQEAIAFAGHNQLDNLILIYDSNDVTLDAMADKTQGWDSEAYFKSLNWDAVTVDGHDMDAFLSAFTAAKAGSGKPTVIIAKTEIGRGISQVAGTASAHGEGGANFSEEARKGLGLPEQTFFVSDETKAYFAAQTETKIDAFKEWQATYDSWAVAHPELASELEDSVAKVVPTDLSDQIPAFGDDYADATRGSGGVVINAVAKAMPSVITGSADLFGSTKNYLKEEGDFTARNPTGRNIWFGIREHGMGAICNGIAYDGLFRISGATFCVFADYLRPSIRIAGTNHIEVWNNPQTTHSFHRLVSRSIFSHSNRVVSQDVGHRKLGKPGDPNRWAKVVGKDAEGRSTYTEETVVSNTVTDSAHSVLANAKPDIAARWITSSKIPLFFEIILSRPKEIGRTSDHRRHRLCNSINNNSTRSTGCISIVITKGWNLIREVSWDYFGHAVLKLACELWMGNRPGIVSRLPLFESINLGFCLCCEVCLRLVGNKEGLLRQSEPLAGLLRKISTAFTVCRSSSGYL